jgi:large subunit ribosomal protein L44e
MKFVKEMNTFCPKCNKHTAHSVGIYKASKQRATAIGARRHEEDIHGYGGQKFPKLVRTAKTTKKQVLRLKCKVCGKYVPRLGIRLRKLEIEQ